MIGGLLRSGERADQALAFFVRLDAAVGVPAVASFFAAIRFVALRFAWLRARWSCGMVLLLVSAAKVGAGGSENGNLVRHRRMHYLHLILVCALALPFTRLMVRMRVLTLGGAIMAAIIALCVVGSQGWPLLLPLFLFLLSGVFLGRLNKRVRTDTKHGRPRDAMQVFCSGGIYALLALYDDFDVSWSTQSGQT